MGKIWAVAVCEFRQLLRSVRTWVALGIGIGSMIAAYLFLRYVNGPGAILSVTAHLFDIKYLTSTLGGPTILVFSVLVVLLGCDCLSRDRSVEIEETIHSHALRNHQLILGRAISVFLVSLFLFALSVTFLLVTQRILLASNLSLGVSSLQDGITYVFGDAAPLLLFWTAVVVFLNSTLKNRLIVACFGIGIVVAHYILVQITSIHYMGYLSGVGPLTPSMPSELLGAAADYIPTLIHRTSIIFLAIGVVGLSVFFFKRRDQMKQTPIVCASLVVLAIGCSIVVGLLAWNDTQQRERMAWIQAHRELDSVPIADLEAVWGDIRIEPGSLMELDLNLSVSARKGEELNELVFSFNPGLSITNLSLESEERIDYTFEKGVLRIPLDETLVHGVQLEVALQATGRPAMRFAYLDEDFDVRQQASSESSPVLALGQDASIFENSYVALMPSIRWLPIAGANFGGNDLESFYKDYFAVDLMVSIPKDWTFAAPDRQFIESSDNKELAFFRIAPSVPIPNFALIASDFASYTMQLEGIELELLLHKQHATSLSYAAQYTSGIVDLVSPWLKKAREVGLDYPYRRFSMVEIPSTLRGYAGVWPHDSKLSSPGVLMFREWTLPAARFESFWKRYGVLSMQLENVPTLTMRYFQLFLDSDSFGASFQEQLWRNFSTFQTQPTGRGALALDLIVRLLTTSVVTGTSEPLMWSHRPDFTALNVNSQRLTERLENRNMLLVSNYNNDLLAYFVEQIYETQHAGWEALSLPLVELGTHRDPHSDWKLLNVKGLFIATMLSRALGMEDTGRFLSALRTKFVGGTYSIEDINDLAVELELPVLKCLEDWITDSGLPGFVVDEFEVIEATDDEGTPNFVTKFVIRNNELVPGVVTARLQQTWSQGQYWMLFPTAVSESMHVDANSSVRLVLESRTRPEYLQIQPFLSHNRYAWDVQLPEPISEENTADRDSRSQPTDGSFQEFAYQVVVDDLDRDFIVENESANPAGFRFVNLFRSGSTNHHAMDQGLPRYDVLADAPQIWSRTDFSGAHGRYRRTSVVAIKTEEENWARFEANLEAPGSWRLQYHLPVDPRFGESQENMYTMYTISNIARAQPVGRQGTYKLRVVQEGNEEPISFDASLGTMGWNDIGTFNLSKGIVGVEVSSASDGSFVYADAVRWLLRDSVEILQNP